MNMRKKIFTLGLMAVVAAAWAAPSFAARPIQGAVGEVSGADAAALGQVGFRIYSGLSGGESNVNDNVSSCRNLRCIRSYVTNATLAPGGYVGNAEATQVYNSDLADQPMYLLVDASMNALAGNHIGYYGVSGVTANAAGVGNFLAGDCSGANAQNCFGRVDNNDAAAVLSSTKASYGAGPNQIRPIGGLNPIPNVRINGVTGTIANLSWVDPSTYANNLRPSTTGGAPVSPVKGVSLWKNDRSPCTDPTGNDPGWTFVANKDLGQTTHADSLVGATGQCRYYALKVRLVGPGGDSNEIDTFEVGVNSQAVSTDVTAVTITRFGAQYAGHGVVNVSWQTGVEGDIRGFKVTRAAKSNGPFVVVSDTIPAAGDGHNYAVTDSVKAGAGKTYYYKLQIIARDGSVTTSSPAAVTLPSRTKKNPAIR